MIPNNNIALSAVCATLAVGLGHASIANAQDTERYTVIRSIDGTTVPVELTFVLTVDEIYTPIGLMKPAGDGPFPAVILASGNGRRGMPTVERAISQLGPYMESFVNEGYVIAFAQYRNEIPNAYGTSKRAENIADSAGGTRTIKSGASLDSDDFISIIQYVQNLPYVDPNGVGVIGSSHGGELILKAASEIDFGAGILGEPASLEYLSIDQSQLPPGAPQLQDIETTASLANKAESMARIERINTPMLTMGRQSDHLQGLFELGHQWMTEAGKDSTWASFDHPRHGYVLIRRQQDGSYRPDDVQIEALSVMMEFLDRHLKHETALITDAR